MRIAVNARFLLPGKLEGIGWYTHELARRMVLAHPEDEFIFFFDRPYDPAFVYAENVRPVVVFPPARHPLLWYCWFEWALPHFLQRFRPDVFFSPDAYLSLRTAIPTVLTVHDMLPLQHPEQVPWGPRRYYRHFLPKYIQRADAVVTVSEYTRQAILATVPVSPEKVSVVYNGCRATFKPLAESDQAAVRQRYTGGAPYFFYAGSIHPRKNVDRLIRAGRPGKPARWKRRFVGRQIVRIFCRLVTFQSRNLRPLWRRQLLLLIFLSAKALDCPSWRQCSAIRP
jgi:glycosyltransferase involved in cell wall biosynthesis